MAIEMRLSRNTGNGYGIDIIKSQTEKFTTIDKHKSSLPEFVKMKVPPLHFPNDSFDFIYSNITLQHINPLYSKRYISEFIRILRPRGILIFQLPCRKNYRNIKQLVKAVVPKPSPLEFRMDNQVLL